jgi:glycosyltransferase involved in cell wall biosynthesis
MMAREYQNLIVPVFTELKPDVVHCHDAATLPIGAAYKAQSGCKLVYDSHEVAEHQQGITGPLREETIALHREHAPAADGFVTVNGKIADYLREQYPRLPTPTVVMNATLPPDAPAGDDGRLRAAAKLPADVKILLFQGGYAPGRGLTSLIQSAEFLPPDWRIVFMGWGSLEPTLRKAAAALPADRRDWVVFLPGVKQAELRHWTAGATVGVIPYENTCLNHWLCSPNKLWEYPYAGVPVLASPYPVMADVIGRAGIGWLLDEPITPEGIARAVAAITPTDLQEKRANCWGFVTENNWSLYAGRLVGLYRGLTGRAA